MGFLQQYRSLLENVSSKLWSREGQGLAEILTTGQLHGGTAFRLFYEYREWGLLHLLVLSGSRYPPFARAWTWLVGGLQRLAFGKSSYVFTLVSLWIASATYLLAMNLPAPLLRCALAFFIASLIPQRKFKLLVIVSTFLVQWMFFEHINPSTSFTLSWAAFAFITLAAQLRQPLLEGALITIVMQITISYMRDIPLTFRDLIVAIVANAICFGLFRKLLFPAIGWVSAIVLLLTPLMGLPLFPNLFNSLVAPAASLLIDLSFIPILVTHGAFRYTFSQ